MSTSSMDPTTEIKARLSIEELVGNYCQVQKAGRGFKALCPFHNDTKPSLTISPDKGIAYCFACQTGGDIFSFYQAIEGVDFPQALKDLAEKAGVTLPKQQFQAGPKKDEKDRIRECLESAEAFYYEKLKETEFAKQYLIERKIPPELAKEFRIGYAPDSFDATYTHLLKTGFSRKEILGAGLGIQKELQQERIYDRFRNRVVFPIRDTNGGIIGFGGRTLGDDDAKYINSPDGPLYDKSRALFGLSHAKEAIRESKTVILVEGYFDVLAFHRIGVKNVVSVSGTAMTEQHVKILKRTAEVVILCLDKDQAGMKASERAFALCAAEDLAVRTLTVPEGNDPDECASLAPEKLQEACAQNGTPFLDTLLQMLSEQNVERRDMIVRLLPLLHSINSAIEQQSSVQKVAAALGTTETAIEDDMKKLTHPQSLQEQQKTASKPSFSATDILLGLLLTYPHTLHLIEHVIEPMEDGERALYRAVKTAHEQITSSEEEESEPIILLPGNIRERASILGVYCEENYGPWSESLAEKEIQSFCRSVNHGLLLLKQKQMLSDIRTARSLGKKGEEEQLLTQYQQVLKLAKMTS